jgi:hypothetical protein
LTRCLPSEDFTVAIERWPDPPSAADPLTVIAAGRLTAAGGELLYGAIVTGCEQAGNRLVADLTAVSELQPAGWSWLLSALRECQAVGCQLQLLLPGGAPSARPPEAGGAVPPAKAAQPAEACDGARPPEADGTAQPAAVSSKPAPARLRCYPDGPILLRGDFELVDRTGNSMPRTRSVVALCRCGGSAIKPFCDGTHKSLRFTDR